VALIDEALRSTLGRIPGVALVGASSTQNVLSRFGSDPAALRDRLGAPWIVEGAASVSPASPDMHVTVRLLEAGVQVWQAEFPYSVAIRSVIPSDIAAILTAKLGLELDAHLSQVVAPGHSTNPEARRLYGEARARMRAATVAAYKAARTELERAVAIDPDYALAHAALVICHAELTVMGVVPTSDAHRAALRAAGRALQLDTNLPEAHLGLANVKLNFERDWNAADRSYRQAISIDPNHVAARISYSRFLAALGRVDEALQEAKVAQQLDQLSDATGNLALILYYARRYDESSKYFDERIKDAPDLPQAHFSQARTFSAAGNFDAAETSLLRALALRPDDLLDLAELARIYAQAGRRADAVRLLDRLGAVTRNTPPSLMAYHGFARAALGERNRAFDLLNQAVDRQASVLLWAKVDPRFDPVRGDPRFQRILARLGLQ
jgi:tetratricopeptide (TPR) repeat protein